MNGMRTHTHLWVTSGHSLSNDDTFHEALWGSTKHTFQFSQEVRSSLEKLVRAAMNNFETVESIAAITRRFMEGGFVEGYFDEQQRIRERKSGNEKLSRHGSSKNKKR
jgi:hypothetical protein